jgi:hypothetical protein
VAAVAARRSDRLGLVLAVLVAAGLVVDAVVHLRSASGYQLGQPGGIGEGNLFRIEAAAALLAAVYVLVRRSRVSFLVAAAVGLGGVVVVVLYRYVDVPAVGPLPSMYEPIWFLQKSLSAVAEGAAGALALLGSVRGPRSRA